MYIYLYIYCMASYITYYFLSGWRQIIPIFLFLLSWAPFIISMLKAYCLKQLWHNFKMFCNTLEIPSDEKPLKRNDEIDRF